MILVRHVAEDGSFEGYFNLDHLLDLGVAVVAHNDDGEPIRWAPSIFTPHPGSVRWLCLVDSKMLASAIVQRLAPLFADLPYTEPACMVTVHPSGDVEVTSGDGIGVD